MGIQNRLSDRGQNSHIRKLESTISNLTSENNRLKTQSKSNSILEEEKISLQSKLERFNSLKDELSVSRSDLVRVEKELQEWKSQINLFDSDDSTTVTSNLGSKGLEIKRDCSNIEMPLKEILGKVEIKVKTKMTEFDSSREFLHDYLDGLKGMNEGFKLRLISHDERIDSLKQSQNGNSRSEEIDNLTMEKDQLAMQRKNLESELVRSSKGNQRLKDEIVNLKNLLKSYEKESSEHASSYQDSHAKRIESLEQDNELKRIKISELEVEWKQSSKRLESINQKDRQDFEKCKKELENAMNRIKSLQIESEKLNLKNQKLDARLRRGEYNPSMERVLKLKDNPVDNDLVIRRKEMESLKSENLALLKRVDELNSQIGRFNAAHKIYEDQIRDQNGDAQMTGAEASADANVTANAKANGGTEAGNGNRDRQGRAEETALIPKQTADNLRLEIEKLNQSIKGKDKAMLRLKQVFLLKAQEYRESVRSLFGYKIKFLDNGKVHLKSIYARSSLGTTLIFKSEEGNVGSMRLQGEAVIGDDNNANHGGSNKVETLRRFWLGSHRQSVPCFLAALNMELYDMTTQAGRAAYNGEDEDED